MKKLILVMAAAAAMAGGSAFAQANSPQFTGVQSSAQQEYPNPYGNSGWTPDMAYGGGPSGGAQVYPRWYQPGDLPLILSDGRLVTQPRYVTPYQPSNRDRDGDGVRNSRDRYPDDPRYR
jgi:hypothetical protein